MFLVRNKIVPTVSVIFMLCAMLYLPSLLTMVIFFSTVTIAASYYFYTHYEIDYKYCLSFMGQLLGLTALIVIFISLFILITSIAFV